MTGPVRSQFDWTLQTGWRRGQERERQTRRAAMADVEPNPFVAIPRLGQDLDEIDRLLAEEPERARSLCLQAGLNFEQQRLGRLSAAHQRAEAETRQAVYDAQRAAGLRI